MEFYEASITIMANADRVWQLISSADALTSWDSGITRIDGAVAPNSKFKLHAAISKRPFTLQVVEYMPAERMVWRGGMPFGLFTGVRTFTLEDSNGLTDVHVREEFSGPLLPLIWKSMPDLAPSFEQFVNGLKQAAETPPT